MTLTRALSGVHKQSTLNGYQKTDVFLCQTRAATIIIITQWAPAILRISTTTSTTRFAIEKMTLPWIATKPLGLVTPLLDIGVTTALKISQKGRGRREWGGWLVATLTTRWRIETSLAVLPVRVGSLMVGTLMGSSTKSQGAIHAYIRSTDHIWHFVMRVTRVTIVTWCHNTLKK